MTRKEKESLDQLRRSMKKKQNKIDNIHARIQRSDPSKRAYEYTKQQAKMTCNLINTARSTGFKKLETLIVDTLLNKITAHELYITTNEYGNAEVDYDRLQELILK